MVRKLLLFIFAILYASILSAYTSAVHEDIIRQALEYLSQISSFDNYTHLHNHNAVNVLIKNAVDEDFADWVYGWGDKDELPLITGVSDISVRAMKDHIKTISHFWNADVVEPVNSSGQDLINGMWLGGEVYSIQNIPSAERKAEVMIYGNRLHHYRELTFKTPNKDHSFITVAEPKVPSQTINLSSKNCTYRVSIYSVDDYILNHNVLIVGNKRSKDYEIPQHVHLSDRDWASLSKQQGDYEEYKYLGRLAHLLTDMCVPTHVHNDIHGFQPKLFSKMSKDLDQYEGWNITGLVNEKGGYLTFHSAIRWTAADVAKIYGYKLIPVPTGMDEKQYLYDLFYTVNQITAMFPSNDCDGNVTANPEHPFSDYPFIQQMQSQILAMHNGSADFQQHKGQSLTPEELEAIQSICIPLAIRAVATLMYWWGNHYSYPHTDLKDLYN